MKTTFTTSSGNGLRNAALVTVSNLFSANALRRWLVAAMLMVASAPLFAATWYSNNLDPSQTALTPVTFTVNGTLKTNNVNGVSGANCSLPASAANNTITLSTSANYEFNGSANQSTTGMPSTVSSLTVNNSGGSVALNQP